MEEAEALVQLMELLKKAEEEQSSMTEEEKQKNVVKMGDIWY